MTTIKLFPFSLYQISGNSMLPTLKPKQKLIGLNWFKSIKENEIVVAEIKDRLIIKRIKKIAENKFWVEGDNKKESTDSRIFGWISKKNIRAKIIYKL